MEATLQQLPPGVVAALDGSAVRVAGELFTFTPSQAGAVAQLLAAWQTGLPDVHSERLLLTSGARSVGELFRVRVNCRLVRHPALGKLIVRGERRGTWRLAFSP